MPNDDDADTLTAKARELQDTMDPGDLAEWRRLRPQAYVYGKHADVEAFAAHGLCTPPKEPGAGGPHIAHALPLGYALWRALGHDVELPEIWTVTVEQGAPRHMTAVEADALCVSLAEKRARYIVQDSGGNLAVSSAQAGEDRETLSRYNAQIRNDEIDAATTADKVSRKG